MRGGEKHSHRRHGEHRGRRREDLVTLRVACVPLVKRIQVLKPESRARLALQAQPLSREAARLKLRVRRLRAPSAVRVGQRCGPRRLASQKRECRGRTEGAEESSRCSPADEGFRPSERARRSSRERKPRPLSSQREAANSCRDGETSRRELVGHKAPIQRRRSIGAGVDVEHQHSLPVAARPTFGS